MIRNILKAVSAVGVLFLSTFIFSLGFLSMSESYHFFCPDIDTQFTAKYNESKFLKIKPGANADSVLRAIGEPFHINTDSDTTFQWDYSTDGKCKSGDFAWLLRAVVVDTNHKVVKTISTVIYD